MALNEKQILEKVNSQFVVSIELPQRSAPRSPAEHCLLLNLMSLPTPATGEVPEAGSLRFAP